MAGKFFFLIACLGACADCMKLTQVLIVSRHNLRTPLTETLERMTPKEWPKWDKPAGQLTEKGALLESYMGEYLSMWLKQEGFFENPCPEANSVHIYANTRQRTKDTAQAFVDSAFPNCDVRVNYKNITEMDPIFNPVVHNMTQSFKETVLKEMGEKLARSNLKEVYTELNRITDIKNSLICKEDKYCDLAADKDELIFEIEIEPNTTGPLYIGNSMVDSFLMSYYEGFPIHEIAWGEIKSESQWNLLTKLVTENQNVRLNLTSAAKELARPLLSYIKEKLDDNTKFTVLVGHDSNLSPILRALEVKPFILPEQYELTPIGGKIVFQKWTDGVNDFLKAELIYQSTTQLRYGEKLSLENPPKKIALEIRNCAPDKRGYCPWDKFNKILNELVRYE